MSVHPLLCNIQLAQKQSTCLSTCVRFFGGSMNSLHSCIVSLSISNPILCISVSVISSILASYAVWSCVCHQGKCKQITNSKLTVHEQCHLLIIHERNCGISPTQSFPP